MKTAKEITLNYLKSIKEDRENAAKLCNCEAAITDLELDMHLIDEVIKIVQESEGE